MKHLCSKDALKKTVEDKGLTFKDIEMKTKFSEIEKFVIAYTAINADISIAEWLVTNYRWPIGHPKYGQLRDGTVVRDWIAMFGLTREACDTTLNAVAVNHVMSERSVSRQLEPKAAMPVLTIENLAKDLMAVLAKYTGKE